MGKHTETVQIPAQEVSRVNRLLAIVSLEELTDSELIEQGANTNQNEEIFCVTFDDGSSLSFYLCSGLCNYWDDVVWTSADENRDVTLECAFELDDIEFEIDAEEYCVKVTVDQTI